MSRARPIQNSWLPNNIILVPNHSNQNSGPTSRKLGVSKKEQMVIIETATNRFRRVWALVDCISALGGRGLYLCNCSPGFVNLHFLPVISTCETGKARVESVLDT